MNRKQALSLAIKILIRRQRDIAFNANLNLQLGATMPSMVNAADEKTQLAEAVIVLTEIRLEEDMRRDEDYKELKAAAQAISEWRHRVGCFPWEMQPVRDMFDRLDRALEECQND